jgi:two-component system, NtrC family, sensor kinase
MSDNHSLCARLQLAESKVAQLEAQIEEQARELYFSTRQAESGARELREVTEAVPVAVLAFNADGLITLANQAAQALLSPPGVRLAGTFLSRCFPAEDERWLEGLIDQPSPAPQEGRCLGYQGDEIPVLRSWSGMPGEGDEGAHGVIVLVDVRERRRLEVDLRQAQKLEAVGRLAAGVAHEINTPAQFVNDSIHFLRDSSQDVTRLLALYRQLAKQAAAGLPVAALCQAAQALEEEIDLAYVIENVPPAFDRAIQGMDRVTAIVRSMKEFAHPDAAGPTSIDLNSCLATVLTLAHSEYKYIAEVTTAFSPLPLVMCRAGEINQVMLNLVVNAAHAIEEKHRGGAGRGHIHLSTQALGEAVKVSIRDDGTGIPPHLLDRIFDPFFTTKAVGKGTGQGLSFVRTMVVEHHGGRVEVETAPGQGTTFHVLLPCAFAGTSAALGVA